MEGLLVVLSFAFLVVLLVTPFLAWSALNRTSRLQKEMEKFLSKQKLLSEQLDRLQSRSSRLQQELQTLRMNSEAVVAPAEMPEKSVERPGALAIVEVDLAEPEEAARLAADEKETAKEQTKIAAASIEGVPGAVVADEEREDDLEVEAHAEATREVKSMAEVTKAPEQPAEVPEREETSQTKDTASEEIELREVLAGLQVDDGSIDDSFEDGEPTGTPIIPSETAAGSAAMRQGDLERKLSTNWLVWVGGIALAMAGIFLIRYIAEQGWLSPTLRCVIGLIFGLALIIAGEVVRRRPMEQAIAAIRPDYVPQALTAAGLFTAFGSVYLAYAFYDLIPSGWSFATLTAITLAAFALSLVQGRFVALLGLAGAVATPALVSTENPSNVGFFSYLGIIVLATLAVADRKRWFWLPELSLVAMAGWTALWLMQIYQDADILPIGATVGIVALAGLFASRHTAAELVSDAERTPPGLKIGAEEVAWTGLIVAGGSAFALALLSDFISTAHWLFLSFAVAVSLIGRVAPRHDAGLPGFALLSLVAFALVYLDEAALGNLSERLLGWGAPTEYFIEKYQKYALHATLIAAALFLGGFQALINASRPIAVALITGAVPLVLLLIGYAQFRNYSGDTVWVGASGATLLTALGATFLLRRTVTGRIDLQGLYAGIAVIAAFLALTFQFDRIWLTLSYTGLVFILALSSIRVDYGTVRQLVNMLVLIVLTRLTVNPDLRGYEIFHPLGMQWVSYGYLVPLALFVAASRILKRQKDDLTVTVLEGAALLLGIVFVSIEIRIYMTGSIYSGEYELPEASLQTIAWLTSALVLARRNLRYPRLFSTWGSRVLTLAGALQAMVLQLVLMNPVFTGDFIDGYGLFNMLILSMAAPAILMWLIAGSLVPPGDRRGEIASAILRGCSALLVFAFVTEEVRVFFQGLLIRPGHASILELYVTTLAWLLPASTLYVVSADGTHTSMRQSALVVMLVSLVMLLLGHAGVFNPALTGEMVRGWPVLNTLVIGFLVPAVALYMVGKSAKRAKQVLLLAGAYLLIVVWVWLGIKNVFQGARMIVLHDSLLELYITTLAWILLGAAPFLFHRIGNMAEAKKAGLGALALSITMLFIGHALMFNPVFDGSFVSGGAVFNVLLLGFILPAGLLGLISGRIEPRLQPYVQIAAYVLLFIGITMLVKRAFQGPLLTLETLTDIEDYGYSAAWLVLALATMIAGLVRDNSHVRYASLAVLLLVVSKVFLLDMSGLAGLWRVASFFGLGISLVGIGYFYQRFMYSRQNQADEPGGETKET